jgi:hypothetical protein
MRDRSLVSSGLTGGRVVFEFFDMLNRFYGVIQEFCTQRNCPSMSAGPGYVRRVNANH